MATLVTMKSKWATQSAGNIFIFLTYTPTILHRIHHRLWKYDDNLCVFRHSPLWDCSCAEQCLSPIRSIQLLWIISLETIREENLCHLTISAVQSLWLLQNWYASLYCSPLIQNILISSVHCRISWFITLTASMLIPCCLATEALHILLPYTSLVADDKPDFDCRNKREIVNESDERNTLSKLQYITTCKSTGSKCLRPHQKSGMQNRI